ncbi:MAG TPA: DctP family TRAP transporter solute-binding subunit [Bacilli bacterium]
MRISRGTWLLLVFGIITAFSVGFWSLINPEPTVYDDEQHHLHQETIIKFNLTDAENSPRGLAAKYFADLVETYTNGQIRVDLFPNAVLYDEPSEIEALQNGNVQMIAPSFSYLAEISPKWAVMDLPFAFPNDEAVQAALHGEIGKRLLQELDKNEMVGMDFWRGGFKQIISSKGPLLHPSDFHGLVFAAPPSRVIESQFDELNAKSVIIPFSQVYHSSETGQINGEEATIANIYRANLYQIQKYITLSGHGYLGYCVIMNKKFWNNLPAARQAEIKRAMDEATAWANRYEIQFNSEKLEELQKVSSLHITQLSPSQHNEWVAATLPVYEKSIPVIGKELIQDIKEIRQKYEQFTLDPNL